MLPSLLSVNLYCWKFCPVLRKSLKLSRCHVYRRYFSYCTKLQCGFKGYLCSRMSDQTSQRDVNEKTHQCLMRPAGLK